MPQLNRRGFLGSFFCGVAATAAVRTWPFRVFSFPKEIKIATPEQTAALQYQNFSRNATRWDVILGFSFLKPDCAVRIVGL